MGKIRGCAMRYERTTRLVLLVVGLLLVSGVVNAAGVTVIIHGWHITSTVPWWTGALQTAIGDQRLGGEQQFATLTVTGNGANLTASWTAWDVDLSSSDTGEVVVKVDWNAVSDHLVSGVAAQQVAAVVAAKIYEIPQPGAAPLAELPVHLVGHSRGGGMVCEIARLLGEQGIDVDHLTPLDPHPLTGADPQPLPPLPAVIDTPVAVYENVLFADSYWQDITYPKGEEISSAYNRLWTSMPGGYHDHPSYSSIADHLNVHLMYHGTVDLTTPASDGEAAVDVAERAAWYNDYETDGGVGGQKAGFIYSLIDGTGDRTSTDTPVTGGDQVVDGYNDDPILGGGGARSSLSWASAHWPNVLLVEVLQDGTALGSGLTSVAVGDPLDLRYVGRDFDSACDVTLALDADRNPYNANIVLTITSENQGASGSSLFESTVPWDTAAVPDGSEGFIQAKVTDGTSTRYLYSVSAVRFAADAEIFADGFESGSTSAWDL